MPKPHKPRWNKAVYRSRFNWWMRWLAEHPAFRSFTLDS